MGSNIVYALVLATYSTMTGQTVSETQSFHLSHSECIVEKTYQNERGRKETFNRKYNCQRIYDAVIRARLDAAHGRIDGGNGYRNNGRIVLEFNN